MPTIPGVPGLYRFFFYSFDCAEQAHVHVRRESRVCKFWLHPLEVAHGGRFSAHDLLAIERLILQHLPMLEEAWDEHCGR
ncbi:MAG: DUF4160 domain-containing protein [Deltaproteobacteria bacterium]